MHIATFQLPYTHTAANFVVVNPGPWVVRIFVGFILMKQINLHFIVQTINYLIKFRELFQYDLLYADFYCDIYLLYTYISIFSFLFDYY